MNAHVKFADIIPPTPPRGPSVARMLVWLMLFLVGAAVIIAGCAYLSPAVAGPSPAPAVDAPGDGADCMEAFRDTPRGRFIHAHLADGSFQTYNVDGACRVGPDPDAVALPDVHAPD